MTKTLTITIFLLSLIFPSLRAQCKIDSFYTYTFNDSNTAKTMTGKTYRTFDDSDYLTEETNLYLDESNGKWIKNSKQSISNDIKGKPLTFTTQNWDITASSWLNDRKVLYTYDNKEVLSDKITQTWDTTSKTWKNYDRLLYTYDSAQRELSSIYQTWSSNQWANSSKTENTYDNQGYITESLRSVWTVGNWEPVTKTMYTYVSGKETVRDLQIWQSGNWKNTNRRLSTYNASGRPENVLMQNWNNANWINSSLENYNYKSTGCIKSTDYYLNWNDNDSAWHYHVQDVYFTEGSVGLDELSLVKFTLYPNPASGYVHIILPSDNNYTLSDVWGHKLLQGPLSAGDCTILLDGLKLGLYVLTIGQQVQKLIVQ